MENKPEVIDLTGDSPPCSPARMNQGEWDRVNNKFIEMIKLSSTSPTFCETETPRKNNRTYRDPPGFKLALGDDKHFLDDISEEMDAAAETGDDAPEPFTFPPFWPGLPLSANTPAETYQDL